MNLFTLYLGVGTADDTLADVHRVARSLRMRGAGFFGACTVTVGAGEWEGISEPVTILTAYTPKGRKECESWAARMSAAYGEVCVACEWRKAPGFRIVPAQRAKAAA